MPRLREQIPETDAFRSLLFIRGGPAQPAWAKGYGLLWIGPRSGSGLCRPGELLRPRALTGFRLIRQFSPAQSVTVSRARLISSRAGVAGLQRSFQR